MLDPELTVVMPLPLEAMMREIAIDCPACACRVTIDYAGRGRPPVYCSERCRRAACGAPVAAA